MNIEACVKKIDKYLKKENVQPYIVDVQTTEELSDIVEHYNVGENSFISLGDYCKNDEYPRIDSFLDDLSKRTGVTFVTELSTFLKLQGERVLKEILKNILGLNAKGHIVILTYQCKKFLNFFDPRLSNRIYIFNTDETSKKSLVFTSGKILLQDDATVVDGLNNVAHYYENTNHEPLYVITQKGREAFPYSLISITNLSKPYSALCMKDTYTKEFAESLGTDEQWAYALEKLTDNSSWGEIIDLEFGNHNTLELAFNNYRFFESNKKWLYFIALKLYGSKNNWVLNKAAREATSHKDFIKQIYRSILDVNPNDKSFVEYYKQRKVALSQLENPMEEVADFCKMVAIKGIDAIYYLTDNTQKEKEMIITLLDKYGVDYGKDKLNKILKIVYPDLHAYLSEYRFKNELLDSYFSQYKYQKVINKIFPEFLDIVAEQSEKREYGLILSPRTSLVEKIDRTKSQLYFMDAMGVEYLGYIMSICSELDLSASVKVCRCELPSITEVNKEFVELFSSSNYPVVPVKELDEIKHHGQGNYDYQNTKLPLYLIRELEIIREILSKINEKLINEPISKVIMISDHGASRLAVINEDGKLIEMAEKGEHSGRCCSKNDLDSQPSSATDAGEYWSLANYDRFKGGRKANVEVHGGATLEEVTVPIIEIVKKSDDIEITIMESVITVSYKKKASIKLFSKTKINDVSVCVDGMYFDAVEIDDNIYQVDMPQIKKAKTYNLDVYSAGCPVVEGLSFTVKKEGSQENSLL